MRPGLLLAAAVAPLLPVAGCATSLVLLAEAPAVGLAGCGRDGPGARVDADGAPEGDVAGYSGEQLRNAALVMNAAEDLGLGIRAQTIGVMTAMGESGLRVLDYGDAVGPDSRGLFQQRDNGAWGSYAERMDPTASATRFFRALAAEPGWASLPPTIAAHRVQRNADPYHYERFWDPAVAVVTALVGGEVAGVAPGTGGLACTVTTPEQITTDGWTRPAVGPVTSEFGWRIHPVLGVDRPHRGIDIGAACGAPVYAAARGRVVQAGPQGTYGNLVVLDHGGGLGTGYAHMATSGILVRVGDVVAAGQQIARVGSTGRSTGCHLHFEVRVGDDFTDPRPFLAGRGVVLG